jgi:transposase InsO family protein
MGGKKVYKKIKQEMEKAGIKCGRDKYFDILREEDLLVKYRKRFVKTTQSHHRFYKYPNLVQDLGITQSEQVWASDITYIKTKAGSMFLFLITDVYSKQIMGYDLSDNLKTINAIKALKRAIKTRIYPERSLIHHSDRGFQYCNPAYTKVLEDNEIGISMTSKYDPYENAVAERVNGILKTEYEIGGGFINAKDARREINHAIWLYNTDRPHLSCKGMVPVEAHRKENYKLKKWPSKFSSRDMSLDENKNLFLTKIINQKV